MTKVTRSAVAAPIAMIFATNDDLALRALDGLTHLQLCEAPTTRNNPMLWVAGHLVQTRAQLLALLGEAFDTGWGTLFNRGATIGDANGYPSRDERVMRDVSQRLQARLAALDDEPLAQPPSMDAPGPGPSLTKSRALPSTTAITLDRWGTSEKPSDTRHLLGDVDGDSCIGERKACAPPLSR